MLDRAPAAWPRRQGASGIHMQAQRCSAPVVAVRMAFGRLTLSTNPCLFIPSRRGHQPLHYHWTNAGRPVTGSAVDGGDCGERWECLSGSGHGRLCPLEVLPWLESAWVGPRAWSRLANTDGALACRATDCRLAANCWCLTSTKNACKRPAADACKRPAVDACKRSAAERLQAPCFPPLAVRRSPTR